jgi:hypothetical protein
MTFRFAAMACPHVAGAIAQLLQQNTLNLAMTSAADVQAVRDALVCASSKYKISDEADMVPNARADSCAKDESRALTPLHTLAVPTSTLDWQCTLPDAPTAVAATGGADFTLPSFTQASGTYKLVSLNLCNNRYTFSNGVGCTGDTLLQIYDASYNKLAANDDVSI